MLREYEQHAKVQIKKIQTSFKKDACYIEHSNNNPFYGSLMELYLKKTYAILLKNKIRKLIY